MAAPTPERPDAPLTPQQAHFCVEYSKDSNATRAAIAAGYGKRGAHVSAARLLKRAKIQDALQRLVDARTAKALVTADRVMQELARIATVDMAGAFDKSGKLLPVPDMPEDVRRAISGFDVEALYDLKADGKGRERVGDVLKVRFYDKNRALHDLADILRLLPRNVELTGKDGVPIAVNVVNYAGAAGPGK